MKAQQPSSMTPNASDFSQQYLKSNCRFCYRQGLWPVLDLGLMPLSDGLLRQDELTRPEERYPLEVAYCPDCSLVQILYTVPPRTLFCEDYPYYSSFSDTLLEHSRDNALSLIAQRALNRDSFVVELASNDGYLLKNFAEQGIRVLGIDPAEGPAQAAEKAGVPTLCRFFTKDLALELARQGNCADVIIANNVLAHVADTNGFVQGIGILLKDDGVAVIEVPYVRDLVEQCEFDTIYHEHLCYFSVTALDALFRRHGLFLNDVRRLSIHGGSLRLHVARKPDVNDSMRNFLKQEKDLGIDAYPYYQDFSRRVRALRRALRKLLLDLKSAGNSIAAYGAAAKGTIMLNYIGADCSIIDFVVDKNIHKQGKVVPGVRIPIRDPALLNEFMPDYVLLLPWNLKDEILFQQQAYRRKGGRFIIPVPKPVIV
jgi:SAM-dependent methyltransferase